MAVLRPDPGSADGDPRKSFESAVAEFWTAALNDAIDRAFGSNTPDERVSVAAAVSAPKVGLATPGVSGTSVRMWRRKEVIPAGPTLVMVVSGLSEALVAAGQKPVSADDLLGIKDGQPHPELLRCWGEIHEGTYQRSQFNWSL